jgi:hypothetical protein
MDRVVLVKDQESWLLDGDELPARTEPNRVLPALLREGWTVKAISSGAASSPNFAVGVAYVVVSRDKPWAPTAGADIEEIGMEGRSDALAMEPR